jgi:hypothetical protein
VSIPHVAPSASQEQLDALWNFCARIGLDIEDLRGPGQDRVQVWTSMAPDEVRKLDKRAFEMSTNKANLIRGLVRGYLRGA